MDGKSLYVSEDAIPYRVTIDLSFVPKNFHIKVFTSFDNKPLVGNVHILRINDRSNELRVTSWKQSEKDNESVVPIFTWKDLHGLDFMIRK